MQQSINLGPLFHRKDPACDAALSSVDFGGWWPKHLVRLSPEACAAIPSKPALELQFMCGWEKTPRGGSMAKVATGRLLAQPLKGGGWVMLAMTKFFQHARTGDHNWILTEANSGEAVVSAPTRQLAEMLALHCYRRAQSGNLKVCLPGLKWRAVPSDFWCWLHADNRGDDHAEKVAPALEAAKFDYCRQ
jgi:hypothetical protein